MRSKIGKIVLTLSLMLCMTTALFSFTVKAEENASATKIDDCSKVFKAYTAERTSAYLEDDKYPTKDGYLFAGWYTTNELPENDEEAVEYAVEDSIPEGTQIVYALFVPDDVLIVQAQASVHLIDDAVTTADENGALRFVTTVDSLLYKKVGFELSYVKDGVEKTATSASNKVYKALYQADSTQSWSVTPSESFCGVSEYFKACTVKNIEADNYGTEFTVKAFWVTMSGDKVYGATAVKVLQDGCVRKTVYVSSTPDIAVDLPYYGTEANPYASLDYAIEHVKDGGTVRVKDSLTVASDATWTKHGKSITITGDGTNDDTDDGKETLDFSTQSAHLNIRDNVTFSALNLKFKQYVFCNGYNVKVASDVSVLNNATDNYLPYIYGGAQSTEVAETNLELYAGSYLFIYGGGHGENAHVTGDTNVVVGPGVNAGADPTSHSKTYLLYGGCRMGAVGGDTNVKVLEAEEGQTPAKFNYVYGGGGYAASTSTTATVEGTTNIEFAGQAYSLYGGGRYGTNADTHVVMTGGEVYQIFGGCENNSMTGNTDVQVLDGKVYRRIYGGCYNNYNTDITEGPLGWGDTLYQVTGYTSVTIGAAAEASLDTDTDTGLLAVSRYDSTFSNEWGVLIFNDDMYSNATYNLSSEIGSSYFTNNQAYHYLVTANSGGDVRSDGNFIYIKPDSGNVATVTIDGEAKHYTECDSYYQLPVLNSSTSQEEIIVTFGTTKATDFIANAAAKISTGSESYAYYETLAQAIAAADKSENATITELSSTAELASITVKDSENGTVTSNYKNCVAGTTVKLTVTPDDGYYCSALSVTKDDAAVTLNVELTIDGTEYTFATEAGDYTVEATFAKKVFDEPTSSTNTSWDLVKQNESTETLANGGTKIIGTVVATDLQEKDKMDAIAFVDKFTEMDFTFVAKDDPSTTAGNSTPGTQVVMDFGDGCSYQIRVVKNSGNIVLRAVGGLEKSVNRYTFTTEQADKFNSADGVEVRIVRYGTEIIFYVDGAYATTVDLSEFDNSIVTDDTEMTVSIKRFGDTGTAIAIPFTVIDTVTPVAVNVKEASNGTVTLDRANYFAGDTAIITVKADSTVYYCNKLSVNKKGEPVSLDKALNMTDTTYSFVVGDNTCTVEATFLKKVFEVATNNGYSSWDLVKQNESTETLENGGVKIAGTVVATDLQEKDKMDAIKFIDAFTEMDMTFVAKDDPSTTAGNSTPGTQVVMDFGSNCSYQIRVVKNSGNIVLRAVGGLESGQNKYTFTTEQANKFNSTDGVKVRIVRYGTEIMFYVDGAYATTVDLSTFTNSIVADDTAMTVSIKRFGDTGTAIAIPFTVVNKVTPIVQINSTTDGTVTKDKQELYSVGDTATLTIAPAAGYYCNSLVVKKDGVAIDLDKALNMTDTTYSFEVEDATYTVDATFAKKVFKIATSNGYTSWNLMSQNESTETLTNGGTKITGTVVATDMQTSDKMDAIQFVDAFTEMDLTFVAKDDPSTTAGNSTPGTQVVMDFGDGCSYQIRVVKNSGNIVLRAVGGLEKSVNRYTFTTEQADKFNSADGVEVRIVRYGTEIIFYVDGAYATTVDLSEFDNSIVTDDTEMTVSIKRFGDTETAIAIPFTVVNKVSPVAVEVYDDASKLVANDTVPADVQNIDLTSNETYSVKLTPQGFDSTAYFKITYVDYLTNETQSVYTPAVAAGESFGFTYQNGVFESETESEIATIRWENRIKATKDVLTVEVVSGIPEVNTIASGATLGNAPMAKPLATTVETTWTIGTNVGSYNHAVTEGFTPGQHYAHTDVITVAKAGTKLTFTDDVKTNSWASNGCYVVSSWKLDGDGEWVLDKDGTNIPGKYAASKTITCTEGYDTFVERYGTEDDDGSITYTYITSKDNENIMFCYYAGKGTTEFPTITSIYSGETGTAEEIALAADTSEWLENDKTRAYYDVFEGKTISVIGDSYMAGSSIADTADVWVNMFATKYNMTMNNHGVNGSTISNYAGSTYNPMVDRWEEDFVNDTPDIIIVEGGRNDYNYNTPMGVLGNSDKATFKGATTYLISSLQEKYPNAIIIGITCWEVGGEKNEAGYYCSDYGRAFIEVCEDLGVSYINSMDSDAMGVYMTSSNYRGRFCIKAGDISHLNEKGMKLVLPVFEQKIYDFYNAYLNQ